MKIMQSPKIELVKVVLWFGFKILTSNKVCYIRCPKCRGLIRPIAKSQRKYPDRCPYCGEDIQSEDFENSHLVLKFIGAGFLLCIVGLIVVAAIGKEVSVFSHLSCVLGGYLASALGLTVKPTN